MKFMLSPRQLPVLDQNFLTSVQSTGIWKEINRPLFNNVPDRFALIIAGQTVGRNQCAVVSSNRRG